MRTFVLLFLVVSALLVAASQFEDLPVAHACSCTDCDPVRDSDVIVGGRVTGWTRSPRPGRDPSAIALDVHLMVDSVWKGSAARETTVSDPASLANLRHPSDGDPDHFTWLGGSGGCQAFNEDPTGRYVILGYVVSGSNPITVSGPLVFYIGSEPLGQPYEAALERLRTAGNPYPPAAGNSSAAPSSSEPSDDWLVIAAIGAGLLLLTLVLLVAGPRNDRPRELRRQHPEDQPPGAPSP